MEKSWNEQLLHAHSCPCVYHVPRSSANFETANFEIPLISKIFEKYFTETFHYCFFENL